MSGPSDFAAAKRRIREVHAASDNHLIDLIPRKDRGTLLARAAAVQLGMEPVFVRAWNHCSLCLFSPRRFISLNNVIAASRTRVE